MDERKVHIDEFFVRQMGDKTEQPPQEVWDALENRLDALPGRKKRFPVWWFWAIVGVVLISATGIIAGLYTQGSKPVATDKARPAKVLPATRTGSRQLYAANDTKPDAIEQKQTSAASSTAPSAAEPSNITSSSPNIQPAHTPVAHTTSLQPKRTTDVLTPAATSGLKTIEHELAGPAQDARKKAQVPAIPKMKDELSAISPQSTGRQNMQVDRAVPGVVAATVPEGRVPMLRDEETLDPLTISKTNIPGSPMPELLASLRPLPDLKGSATQIESQSAPAEPRSVQPDNTMLQEPDNMARAGVDNDKKKKNKEEEKKPADTTTHNMPEMKEAEKVKERKKIHLVLSGGVKAGYSMGTDNAWRANKIAIAPYVTVKLPANLSLTLQPSFQAGNAKVGNFTNGDRSYYDITSNSFDSSARVVRGVIDSTVVTANPPDTVFRTYTYRQTYDSLHVHYGVSQKQLWDVELPLILSYQLNKTFSVFAGGSLMYSSVLQTKVDEQRFQMSREYAEQMDPQTFYVTMQGQEPPAGPARKAYSNVFTNNGDPFSSYVPQKTTTSKNFMRYGYMIGGSATINERWMIDIMLHKTGVDANAVPDKQLRRIYSQPYIRVMIGYKLFGTNGRK